MIRAGHTSYTEHYLASATYRRARRREALRMWVALTLGTFAAALVILGAVWGATVWVGALPAMFN